MDTLQNNESDEAFRKLPHTSEPFGNVPKASERNENHILTVHVVARKFEESGVPRTERSITNWCQPDRNGVSRLDCYFDTNERKYYMVDGNQLCDLGHATQTILFYRGLRAMAQSEQSLDIGT